MLCARTRSATVATAPLGVFVDIDIIRKAPKKLLSSGCGDLVANMIAVRDWELGRDKTVWPMYLVLDQFFLQ